MRKSYRTWLFVMVVAAGASGCDGSSSPSDPDASTGTFDGGTASDGSVDDGAIDPGGDGGSNDGGSNDGGEYWLELAEPERGIQVRTVGTMIESGTDVEYCEVVQLPGTPDDIYYVNGFELAMSPLSHHLIVTALEPGSPGDQQAQVGDRTDCIGAEFLYGHGSVRDVFGSQQPFHEQFFPEGVGKTLRGGQKLVFDYHYFNPTEDAVPARAALNLHVVDSIEREAYSFSFNKMSFSIPAGQTGSTSASCTFTDDVVVSSITRHTHRWGTNFSVWFAGGERDGEHIWTSRDWEHEVDFDFEEGPVTMSAGEGFRFECEFDNTTSGPLSFGLKATDEMCILFGTYWAAEPGGSVEYQTCDR